MFRLKALDDNETPESIMSGGRHRPLDPSLLVPAKDYIHTGTHAEFLKAQPEKFNALVVAAAVFYKDRLLLVQRAEGDSYPGHWELPGGMADASDKIIYDAVKRELREETGLTLDKVIQQILPAETFVTGWGKRAKNWLKVSFVVDVTAEAKIEAGQEVGIQQAKEKAEEQVAVETKKLEELMDDADEELYEELERARAERVDDPVVAEIGVPVVKLNPKEHQYHLWVKEEEVKNMEVQGKELQFIAEAQVQTILSAFKIHKEIEAEMAD
ncbi:hypothetical protein AAFC00_002011 [Neodothiora populina]|uniref:Nudix hydrolase domain-containing protein n=1 Tax=Neodothiora populina TaxID=2781224 RepID=A0ABR3PGA0_9PEZI